MLLYDIRTVTQGAGLQLRKLDGNTIASKPKSASDGRSETMLLKVTCIPWYMTEPCWRGASAVVAWSKRSAVSGDGCGAI